MKETNKCQYGCTNLNNIAPTHNTLPENHQTKHTQSTSLISPHPPCMAFSIMRNTGFVTCLKCSSLAIFCDGVGASNVAPLVPVKCCRSLFSSTDRCCRRVVVSSDVRVVVPSYWRLVRANICCTTNAWCLSVSDSCRAVSDSCSADAMVAVAFLFSFTASDASLSISPTTGALIFAVAPSPPLPPLPLPLPPPAAAATVAAFATFRSCAMWHRAKSDHSSFTLQ